MTKIPPLIFTLFMAIAAAVSAEPLKVVTTMATFADIAQSIGGDRVTTSYIASPKFNPHFIEPRPSDILKVKRADLFIHGGLDLEAWRGPLLDAVARADLRAGGARQLDLSTGISLLEVPTQPISRAEGDIHIFGNPHYWTDPRNGRIIAQEIANKLSELDAAGKDIYQRNAQSFQQELESRMDEWQKKLAPVRGREFVGYHNEWLYLMEYCGFQMTQFLEPKPGVPPTPRQVEFLISYISEKHVAGLTQATYFSREAADAIVSKTGRPILVLAQNVGELPEAKDYISMLDYNISQLLGATKHD